MLGYLVALVCAPMAASAAKPSVRPSSQLHTQQCPNILCGTPRALVNLFHGRRCFPETLARRFHPEVCGRGATASAPLLAASRPRDPPGPRTRILCA
ncbi:hypothetical protein CALVIDRAFT_205221 [Calocera viscosa TUFC12733]|uniref:Secreted protein n=1 Tax=Calocera viscosa (strain TUFC12733) TaxID=1330018 RepID=A0A167KDC0_CALVF|nr:hypothetical protein CALVIDRAFT_205221 [Calocera viscosa TUFC12733]